MKKTLLFTLFTFITGASTFAQYFYYDDKYYDSDLLWEAGASVGIMNAVTDVGERKGNGFSPKFYDFKSSKISMSAYFSILYKSTFEGRLEVTKGKIAGKDANSNSAFVRSRNLNYQSNILEVALLGSFHPLMLLNTEYLPTFSPYVIAGVSGFAFKPKTDYHGELLELRPLNTEGQNSSRYPARQQYSLKALSLPVGIGVKYEYSAKFNIRLEGLARLTNTDYLDDVSTTYVDRSVYNNDRQKILAHRYVELSPNEDRTGLPRGKEKNKDKFFNISLKIGYVIGREKRPLNIKES